MAFFSRARMDSDSDGNAVIGFLDRNHRKPCHPEACVFAGRRTYVLADSGTAANQLQRSLAAKNRGSG